MTRGWVRACFVIESHKVRCEFRHIFLTFDIASKGLGYKIPERDLQFPLCMVLVLRRLSCIYTQPAFSLFVFEDPGHFSERRLFCSIYLIYLYILD